jgi:hypothetical protein
MNSTYLQLVGAVTQMHLEAAALALQGGVTIGTAKESARFVAIKRRATEITVTAIFPSFGVGLGLALGLALRRAVAGAINLGEGHELHGEVGEE